MSDDQTNNKLGQFVGAKIRAERLAQKLTQSQLALPEFSVSYISAIERGQIHPSLRALEILAQRLGLPSAELIPSHTQSNSTTGITMNSAKNDDAAFELEILVAHTHILQGAAAKAITQLEELATNKLRGSYHIRYHYLLGWAYLLTAQWQACMDALAKAEIIAKECNDDSNSLLIRNLMGMAYAATGDYMQALKTHQYCLALVEKRQPQDPFFLCHLYNQLGQHLAHLNDHDSTLDAFQQALAIIEELNKHEHLQAVYIDIALQYSAASEYEQASISFYKCIELQNQRKPLPLQSEIYRYLGQALMMSDQEKARTYLEGVLQHHSNELDALTQASILTNLAEWFLLNNHLEEAEQYVEKAEQYVEKACKLAQSSGRTLITSDALIMRGRICYAQAKYENGDEYFAAGLEMLEELNLPAEQSSQSALYAQLLDKQGKTKEAFKYYKQAYERKRRAV